MSGAQREPLAVHERYMARALELAERGRGSVSPNPMVGCVIVRDDEIVGEGWHVRAGEPHAEIHALRAAGEAARGATAYVTLEPCDHHGRTPPCSEALIAAGLRRVVIATLDPDARVNGAGARRLQEAGTEVVLGVLADEAKRQNEAFFSVQLAGRPFVLYKTAMTLDGKLATRTGQSRWITGVSARVRDLRVSVRRWLISSTAPSSAVMRSRMRRRSTSSLVSPGPRVPMPPPKRESCWPRPVRRES